MKVRNSYLRQQFADMDDLLARIEQLVADDDLTLGPELVQFEEAFAAQLGAGFAIGVGSGSDALKLSLRALEVGPGDEVVTAANASISVLAAIAELGARPVLVDCTDSFCLDTDRLRGALTPKTKAIVPVHEGGYVADMPTLCALAARHGVPLVEDARQALLASVDGRNAGTWGRAGAFSLHPHSALNVWGDGGVIVTSEATLAEELRLLRNPVPDRGDQITRLGCHSRLDTMQAVVASWLLGRAQEIATARIARAEYYDVHLRQIDGITLPPRPPGQRRVFHRYVVFARERDGLLRHCQDRDIECEVHHRIPSYRQEAARFLGHKRGDFPMTDHLADVCITFPCHQHLGRAEQDFVIETVDAFYRLG